ncbi:hypothetical protein NUW58_g2267 [Xylaria curta]|uniref:Uncharacterized protein n=1 Tax=Xylaria curta TaxID=42375 RepID=A0ACC1PJM5_9PEZI|nr:hypothetical protein NUW58_g2267 [Xylaria curta]
MTMITVRRLLSLAGAALCVLSPASSSPLERRQTISFQSTGNPILADGSYYSGDPAPIVVNNTVYIISGRDQAGAAENNFGINQWQIFESANPNPSGGQWTLHANVVQPQNVFSWARAGSAYAAQIVQGRNGKFYLYAPVSQARTSSSDPFAIGVAVADNLLGPYSDAHPSGPIISQTVPAPGNNIQNIDPTVLVDDDGRVYIYFGTFGQLLAYELNTDMVTIKSTSVTRVSSLTGFFEAPWLMKRKSTYYMLYAGNNAGPNSPCTPTSYHACIAYGTASSPLGPWTYRGIVLDIVSSTTSHPGVFTRDGGATYYLVYHTRDATGRNALPAQHRARQARIRRRHIAADDQEGDADAPGDRRDAADAQHRAQGEGGVGRHDADPVLGGSDPRRARRGQPAAAGLLVLVRGGAVAADQHADVHVERVGAAERRRHGVLRGPARRLEHRRPAARGLARRVPELGGRVDARVAHGLRWISDGGDELAARGWFPDCHDDGAQGCLDGVGQKWPDPLAYASAQLRKAMADTAKLKSSYFVYATANVVMAMAHIASRSEVVSASAQAAAILDSGYTASRDLFLAPCSISLLLMGGSVTFFSGPFPFPFVTIFGLAAHHIAELRQPHRAVTNIPPNRALNESLRKKWDSSPGRASASKWADIDAMAKSGASKGLDAQALLEAKQDSARSPFVVHPGTGRVCVPIDTARLDAFDPLAVPTVQALLAEIGWLPYIEHFRSFVLALMRDERDPSVKRERDEGEGMEF